MKDENYSAAAQDYYDSREAYFSFGDAMEEPPGYYEELFSKDQPQIRYQILTKNLKLVLAIMLILMMTLFVIGVL